MNDESTVIRVSGVAYDYRAHSGAVHAVRDVSFSINAGERFALVGESGSGKSVTALSVLRLLADARTSGRILWSGEDLLTRSERELRSIRGAEIAMIFQEPMTALNPLYPVGNTAHLNVSTIWTLPATPLFKEASLLGEVGWNRRLSVTNGGTLADASTRDAWGLRMMFTPTYRQVFAGMDLDVPIGLGYNPKGTSQAVSAFNGGMNRAGDLSVGVSGNYLNTWKWGLNLTHYFGAAGTTLEAGQLSFKQDKQDRDFVSLTVQTTF